MGASADVPHAPRNARRELTMPTDDTQPEPQRGQQGEPQQPRLSPEELARRKDELMLEGRARITDAQAGRAAKEVSQSRIGMRMLLLPAFGIVLFMSFGSRAGAPLGVHAAFTPGGGESFAGPRTFGAEPGSGPASGAGPMAGSDDRSPIQLSPGDVVGTKSGTASVLELGNGRLVLESGARAVLSSLMPPRARLLGGKAQAEGRLKVVTAHGIFDIDSGVATLSLSAAEGLVVHQVEGTGLLRGPGGEQRLKAGDRAVSR